MYCRVVTKILIFFYMGNIIVEASNVLKEKGVLHGMLVGMNLKDTYPNKLIYLSLEVLN